MLLRRFLPTVAWLTSTLLSLPLAPTTAAQPVPEVIASPEPDWPQFRGPRRNGVSAERNLLPAWPAEGPKLLWSAELFGKGFSSPIVVKDRLFLTGDVAGELKIFALDLAGKILWQTANGAAWQEDYPGARSSVTFSEGRIYHENAHGRVACLDAQTGAEQWAVDVRKDFGGLPVTWGLSECLLVDEAAVYVTAGGSGALMVALDKKNGSVRWKSAPLRDSEGEQAVEAPGYVSPILVRFAGRRLVIGASARHLFCVDATDGTLQWTHRMPTNYSVIAMMPAVVGDGIFMTAPLGRGGRFLRMIAPTSADQKVGVEPGWSTPLDTLQGGVVQTGGKIIGSFYPGRKGWAALDAKTGETLFTAPDIVKGAGLLADGRLYALAEDGWMHLLEIGSSAFETRGRFRIPAKSSGDAWAHPVIHAGRLYLRFHDTLWCYDVRAGS